ncbi:DNA-directed RNA polymerase II subunit RPB4 [Pelomyxa schiedti]|nr:DNA-directed RNA polymerase II subunit RPB4 [Pelomyxa schiedti]
MHRNDDVAQLDFGPDFPPQTECLCNSEVFLLLSQRKEMSHGAEMTNVFTKTLQYVERFSHFKDQNSNREVRRILETAGLRQFEVASIANIMPETAEEAKALIPSLVSIIEDDALQQLLDEILALKRS